MSSGRAVRYSSPLWSSDVCWWSSCCGPVRSPWSRSGREGQRYAQDWHCFWDLRWVSLEDTHLLSFCKVVMKDDTKRARQTASNCQLFLAKLPFTATNWHCHTANTAAIALNKHDTAAMLVKWGQEESELSSEEAEVLSAGCRLYSLSGRTDNTIIMESVLCVALWQLKAFR